MSKTSKTLIIIGALIVIFTLIVVLWPKKSVNTSKKGVGMVPASIVIIPTQDKTEIKSTTGAKSTILSDDEYKQSMLIYTLRQLSPIKNDYFEIIYDYGIDKFKVAVARENVETFLQWKKESGYNFIADQYWQIKTND